MPSVTRADMGAYMCIARNGVPPATSKIFKLIVNCKSQYIYGGKKIMRNSGGSDLPIFQQQKRVVFDKRTIKDCIRCSCRCLGTSAPKMAHLCLILCISRRNAQGKSRALEGCHVSSKNPSRVRDRDEEVAGRYKRKIVPDKGSFICPLGK